MLLVPVALIYVVLVWFLVRHGARREATAFVVAPLVPGVAGAILSLNPLSFVVFAPFSYIFALPAIPFFFLYRRLGWTNLISIGTLGALLGALAGFPMNAITLDHGFNLTNIHNFFLVTGCGALVGIVFWVFAYCQFGPRTAGAASMEGVDNEKNAA